MVAEDWLRHFTLDLHGLNVSRVKVNGLSTNFSRAGDKLTITPRWPIPKYFPFYVSVEYSGIPDLLPDPTAPGVYELGWFKYQNTTYVLSEPVGASTFFPANDEPTDKAFYRFTVTVPSAYTVAANGTLRSTRTIGANKRFVWEMRQPMMTWLATVQVNRFRVTQTRAPDGTPIIVYASPGTPAASIPIYARAGQMIPYFERRIGPYPFEGYGSVTTDDPRLTDPELGYALETQAISTFPSNWADDFVVAHELAHQWFGNSASVKRWEDLWLAEGTATYFELLWPYRNDRAQFEADLLAIYDLLDDGDVGPAVVDAPDQMFTARTYYRGVWALYALELKVGQPKLFRVLRAFATTYRGRNATTHDFIRLAVAITGDGSVRALLNDWLYEEALPPLPPGAASASTLARRGSLELPHLVGLRCGQDPALASVCWR